MRIIEKIFEYADSNPTDIAIIQGAESVDYWTLADNVRKRASQIHELDMNVHEPFGIMLPNSINFIEWFLASCWARKPVVLIPSYFHSDELYYHISEMKLKHIVLHKENIRLFNQSDLRLVAKDCFMWENHESSTREMILQEDDMIVQFTSGSEGQSKAVVRSAQSILSELECLKEFFCTGIHEVFVPVSAMCHSFGLVGGTLYPLVAGYTLLIVDSLYIRNALFQMATYKASYVFASPFFYEKCTHKFQKETLKLSTIKRCYTGGSAISQKIVDNFYKEFKLEIYQDYGSTETGTMALGIKPLRESLDLGKFIGNAKWKIIKDIDSRPNEHWGELAVKNECLGFRYLYPAGCNYSKIQDGYYLTGDMVQVDEKRHLFFKFRCDGCVNIAGLKVYPSEVEQRICKMESVKEAAVIAHRSAEFQESLVVYIVCEDNCSVSEQQVRAYCKLHLADYKVPRKVVFVEKIEKNASGKVLKKYLL